MGSLAGLKAQMGPLTGLDLSTGSKLPTSKLASVYWPILEVVFQDLGFSNIDVFIRALILGGRD